jgi:hypothetical protein
MPTGLILINVDPWINIGAMKTPPDPMTAREAASFLGVKVETLYAYASRGLIKSLPGSRGPARRYARADLDALRARSSGPAASALRFGEPVLDTRITRMRDAGPEYRGRSAVALARDGTRSRRPSCLDRALAIEHRIGPMTGETPGPRARPAFAGRRSAARGVALPRSRWSRPTRCFSTRAPTRCSPAQGRRSRRLAASYAAGARPTPVPSPRRAGIRSAPRRSRFGLGRASARSRRSAVLCPTTS